MGSKNCIIVASHKQAIVPSHDPYHLVGVGENPIVPSNAWQDSQGDSISSKNNMYCELTALYWVWKNKLRDYDALGLCHYRRYFSKNPLSEDPRFFLGNNDIDAILANYDIILPQRFFWERTVEENYFLGGAGRQRDLQILRQVISALCPSCTDALEKTLRAHSAYYCNMFIANSTNTDLYCSWLFSILEEVESRIDTTGYSTQEQRVIGYLGEILINVWVLQNSYRIKMVPMVFLGSPLQSKLNQLANILKSR